MGDFLYYVYYVAEGPLLWFAFSALGVGIFIRITFYLYVMIKRFKAHELFSAKDVLNNFGRPFVPFHKLIVQKPLYIALLYIFHICLFVVPIWLEGHIVLWEESRFEWFWTPLPEAWADWMTLVFIGIAAIFFIRRIIILNIRHNSTKADFLILILTALPFLTGYFLIHGSLDSIPFLANHMQLFHVLSGEVMICMVLVLFLTSRFNIQKCSGCGACALDCPTGAIQMNDNVGLRVFRYSHYKCVVCLACVKTCPEEALELKHKIGFSPFLQTLPQEKRSVELTRCKRCGDPFVPSSQLARVENTINQDHIFLCTRCKRAICAEIIYPLPFSNKMFS
jgi:ferredoxin